MNSEQPDSNPLSPKSAFPAGRLRSPLKFALVAIVVSILILIGLISGIIPRRHRQVELNAKTLDRTMPTVTVVSPGPAKPGKGISLPAEIKPWVEAPIYARANGYLKQRFVDIGDTVEAGRLLAEIDTPEIDQDSARARAQLAQAEAALELSKITVTRWNLLLETASVSDQDAAEKRADFKLKTANVAAIRADVARLEKLQSFSRITAPFRGTITARNIDAGDLIVAGGAKELFHLAQTDRLRVQVPVPQSMARGIEAGQSAEITFPELPGRVFTAKVIRTAGVIAPDSRTLLVELDMDNTKDKLFAGGFASVRFPEAKATAALTLPANTVLFRPEGPQIGVIGPDNKVEIRGVKLGRDFGRKIEILSGVSAKDRVIVNPADSLASGTAVSIVQLAETEKKP